MTGSTVDIVGPPKGVGFVVLSRSNMALVACLDDCEWFAFSEEIVWRAVDIAR